MKWLVPLLLLATPRAFADPPCGAVEVRFKPGVKNLQMVVWIEDSAGTVVSTPYITRTTGQFGLANRPGTPLLKTNYRWPYGRREMVAPIWAHHRNKHYPKVVMGGICGNSPSAQCPDHSSCSGQCEDSTIAYHERVSSFEPFYCPPMAIPDAMSCASQFTGSKGAYADPPAFSLYPPRADLTSIDTTRDAPNLGDFKLQNDLVAVSAATPPANLAISPPLLWYAAGLPAGDFTAWIEMSQEADFNASHDHPNQPDTVGTWDFEGFKFLGQPSVVYKVPFRYDVGGGGGIATQYSGYSTWDGSDGTIHPPDGTITTNKGGSGAGRLIDINDGIDVYRVKVVVGNCAVLPDGGILPVGDGGVPDDGGVQPSCDAPDPIIDLQLHPNATGMGISFRAPPAGAAAIRYEVRYQGSAVPISGAIFDQQLVGPSLAPAAPNTMLSTELTGLKVDTPYAIAVRAVAVCGRPSAVVSQVAKTETPKFAVLHGCFVATAAYGTPLAASVQALRTFRDRHLLSNPAGRLFTAIYYTFSPPLARAIDSDDRLRALARAALSPLTRALGVTRDQ